MDAKKELQQFKQKFDPLLVAYLDEQIADAQSRDKFTASGLEYCKKMIMAGGKRLRPALAMWGYQGAGGDDTEAMMQAALSVELLHAFLLVHDDIMDRDATRHGVDTIHERYRKQLRYLLGEAEAVHAGQSIALVFGDILNAFGNHALFTTNFDKERIFAALTYLQQVIHHTIIGQLQDVMAEYRGVATREETLRMYEYKTARYTIESPLVLGAILAGANEAVRAQIHDFAIPLGIAFQIRDDILGVFGDAKTLGKPVGSDIREGKITLLVVTAREKAPACDVKILNELLGKKDLSQDDIAQFRAIITDCGARGHAEQYAEQLISDAHKSLDTVEFTPEIKKILTSLASYMTKRSV